MLTLSSLTARRKHSEEMKLIEQLYAIKSTSRSREVKRCGLVELFHLPPFLCTHALQQAFTSPWASHIL